MKNSLLSNINNPTDLRLLDEAQLPQVAQELRDFIIDIVAVKKGILANLIN
jgi:1-deoxy-D-xylulose-5-phosphate synthase